MPFFPRNLNKIISQSSVKVLIEDLDLGLKSDSNLQKKIEFFRKTENFNLRVDSTSKCNFMVYKFIKYIFRVFIL